MKLKTIYGVASVNPKVMLKVTAEPVNKWLVFLEDLKLLGLYFMMFFCWFVAIFSLSLIGG